MLATQHIDAPPFEVVVVVGSQGGRVAFHQAFGSLPATFPAGIVFALHRSDPSGIAERLLAREISLPVCSVVEGQAPRPGTVYLAPWNRLLAFDERCRLKVTGPPVVSRRDAMCDELLISAARALGPRLIAVVLSGRLDGGARGIAAVRRRGGRVLVQDPTTAEVSSMPNAALATGCADFSLTPPMLGQALLAFCGAPGA